MKQKSYTEAQINTRKRILLALAVILALAAAGMVVSTTLADPQDFMFNISWNGSDPWITGGGKTYTYASSSQEQRLVRLKVSYKNTQVREEYPENSIIITVPGIKEAIRSGGGATPIAIAADKSSVPAAQQIYDWNYSYSPGTDTYTFFNNKPISVGATFAGSFEIIWQVDSRASKDGVSLNLQAKLKSTLGDNLQSDTIHYIQTRQKDLYTLDIAAAQLYSASGFASKLPISDRNPKNYNWVQYNVTGSDVWKALDVNGAEQFDFYVPAGAVVVNGGFSYVGPGTGTHAGEDLWRITRDVTSNTSNPWWGDASRNPIVVAYPKETFLEGVDYTVRLEIWGTYFENTAFELLAQASVPIRVEAYDYYDPPGDIYHMHKASYGLHNAYVDAHDGKNGYCNQWGAINSMHMPNAGREYYSSIDLTLLPTGREASAQYFESFDIEVYDDFMDVETISGELRRLRDDEFEFTRAVIPANTSLVNANWQPLQPGVYDVELWVRFAGQFSGALAGHGEDDFVKLTGPGYDGLKIGTAQQSVALPAGVVGVKYVVRGLKEGIRGNSSYAGHGSIGLLYYKFHTGDPDVRLNNGRVINNFMTKIFAEPKGGGEKYWLNDNRTEADYDSSPLGQRNIANDRLWYGNLLDRKKAELHVLDIPLIIKTKPSLARGADTREVFNFIGGLTASFEYPEGDATPLDDFSLYTIVPQHLRLTNLAADGEALKKLLTFSGNGGLDDAALRAHCAVEVIRDYKGSGRDYIAFHFTGLDARPTSVSVSGIPMYISRETLPSFNLTLQMESYAFIDQSAIRWYGNSTDNHAGVFSDMDRNGVTAEQCAWENCNLLFVAPENTMLETYKLVETERTAGFVLPWKAPDTDIYDIIPATYMGHEYSYKLRAKLGDNQAGGFLFCDVLETAPLMQWQGTFLSVDTAEAEALLGAAPTIYYSPNIENIYEPLPSDFEPALPSGNWTTVKPAEVRSIAVKFPDTAVAPKGAYVSVTVRMLAPSGPAAEAAMLACAGPYITENRFAIHYTPLNDEGEPTTDGRQHLPSNDVPVQLSPYRGVINLRKTDATSGQGAQGAQFSLYRKLGAQPDPLTDTLVAAGLTTNAGGNLRAAELLYGDYYFVETKAPPGYVMPPANTYFEVTLDDTKPDREASLTVPNGRKDGQVALRKVSDLNADQPVAGAVFELYNKGGSKVSYAGNLTTDAAGELTLTGLPWGDYYLQEVTAPQGYTLPDPAGNKFSFTISAATDAGQLVTLNVTDPQVPADMWLQKYEMLEDGTTTTATPVEGAVYALFRDSNKARLATDPSYGNEAVDKRLGVYVTDENGKVHVEDLAFGDYYFKELTGAQGYLRYELPIKFILAAQDSTAGNNVIGSNENDENRTLITYDTRRLGSIWLQKLDDAGVIVDGAAYSLYLVEGESRTLVETRVTGQEPLSGGGVAGGGWLRFGSLKWGTYIVVETASPKGYELNKEEYEVTVDRVTVNKPIDIEAADPRGRGSLELIKYAQSNESLKLEGAVFELYRDNGTLYSDATGPCDSLTTDENGLITIDGLPWGLYYLQEKTAPAGFGLYPDPIRFAVNRNTAGVVQALEVPDPEALCDLIVTKKIKKDDIVFAHGEPTFLFTAHSDNAGGMERGYTRMLVFDQAGVEAAEADGDGYIQMSVTFANIPAGIYTVTEGETQRYALVEVEVNGEAAANATLELSEDAPGEVTFKNDKTTQEDLSHCASVVNMIRRQRILTAVTAEWLGTGPAGQDGTIDRSLLDVYAHYDDGSSRKLGDGEYTLLDDLSNVFVEPMDNLHGEFMLFASYAEGGRTRKGAFGITIAAPKLPPKFQFVMNTQLGNQADNSTCLINNQNWGTHVQLSIAANAANDYLINWGDGSPLQSVKGTAGGANPLHDYDSHGEYTISIIGNVAGDIIFGGSRYEQRLTEVLTGFAVSPGRTSFANCFRACTNLKSIPANLFASNPQATNFTQTFYNCIKLAAIPTGLFANNPAVTTFQQTFYGCTSLTSLPAGLFGNNPEVTTFYQTFVNCSGLITIPTGLFDNKPKVTTFQETFLYCTKLTAIPAGLFSGCVKASFSGTFNGCTSLASSIPADLFAGCVAATTFQETFRACAKLSGPIPAQLFADCAAVTTFQETFFGCASLTGTIPAGLFDNNKKVTTFQGAFSLCSGLTGAIPAGLFDNNPLVTTFAHTFADCTNLTSIPVGLFDNNPKAANFKYTFYQCALTSIPAGLFDSNPLVTDFTCTFGSCTKLTAIPAGLFDHNPLVDTFYVTFSGCSKLTSIPAGLFDNNTQAADFQQVFANCTGLASIPTGFFDNNTKATNFKQAFGGCTGLLSIPAGLFDNNPAVTTFELTFYNCTGLTAIPAGLFDNNTAVTSFTQTFSGCTGLLSVPPDLFLNCKVFTSFNNVFQKCTGFSSAAVHLHFDPAVFSVVSKASNPFDFGYGTETGSLYVNFNNPSTSLPYNNTNIMGHNHVYTCTTPHA